MHRHGRQAKLAEVGEGGQARIAVINADVRALGLAGEVLAAYLAGAGVGRLRVRNEETAARVRAIDAAVEVLICPTLEPELGHGGFDWSIIRDPAARCVAEGAGLALSVLRAAIDGAP